MKGQGWLYDAMHLGGLYYDGNSAERSTQQRIRRMTENLPETNGTLAVFDVHGRGLNYVEELPFFDSMYAKAVFPLCFILKMSILSRQARDKRRESTQNKKNAVLSGGRAKVSISHAGPTTGSSRLRPSLSARTARCSGTTPAQPGRRRA